MERSIYCNTGFSAKMLIAMPGVTSGWFQRSVVYICGHDNSGAMGLIINKPINNFAIDRLRSKFGYIDDSEMKIYNGGPFETERGFILHTADQIYKETIIIDKKVAITSSNEALYSVLKHNGFSKFIMCFGYSNWLPGQLEEEILNNNWLVIDPDYEILFSGNIAEKWELILNRQRINPGFISTTFGRA